MPKQQEQPPEPSTVHIVLQGKGGVGKSYVAALLTQYLRDKQRPVTCFDVDPVNATLSQYASIQAEHVNVLRDGSIHEKKFDYLIDRLCDGSGTFVIDTGATTFVPLWNYICRNEAIAFLHGAGRRVLIHAVVAGGQALTDTVNGFQRIAATLAHPCIVVWVNEFFGEVRQDGKPFEEFRVAIENADKLIGVVVIEERNKQTFGEDVQQMLTERILFEEARRSSNYSLIAKQRLSIVRRDLYRQLDGLPLT